MTRYTIHVPRRYNDGAIVGPDVLDDIERELLDIAGGFTSTEGTGAWRSPTGEVYREPVQLYTVDTEEGRLIRNLADYVAERLDQEAVYLTAAEVDVQLVTPRVPA